MKQKKQFPRSPWMSKNGIVCIGMTLASLWSQATFYRQYFGLALAVSISAAIELARLSSMGDTFTPAPAGTRLSFFRHNRAAKTIYIIVAVWCLSANSLSYIVKAASTKRQELTKIDALAKKVVNLEIQNVNDLIRQHEEQNIQNAGLIAAGVRKARITGIKTEREGNIKALMGQIEKLTKLRPQKKSEYVSIIVQYGQKDDISAMNDIVAAMGAESVYIGNYEVSFISLWLIFSMALALLIEIVIARFGYLTIRGASTSVKSASTFVKKLPGEIDIPSRFRQLLKDERCREWLRQYHDAGGLPTIDRVSRGHREKYTEFRQMLLIAKDRHPELLEVK